MKVAIGETVFNTELEIQEITWEEMCVRITKPLRLPITLAQYQQEDDKQKKRWKDCEYFICGDFQPPIRKEEHLLSRSAVTLDLDDAVVGLEQRLAELVPYQGLYYSTFSSTKEQPRLRVVIPLLREVNKDEYRVLAQYVAMQIGLEYVDPASFKPVQPMYVPHCLQDTPYMYGTFGKSTLNPDVVLLEAVNNTKLPSMSGKKEVEDPTQKKGIIGVFCKTYTLTQAITKFLSDIYQPSELPNRYDYLQGKGKNGLLVIEDKWAFSFDSTDPANTGHRENAFDLVRLHLFSEAKLGYDESMKQMLHMVQEDKLVVKSLNKFDADVLREKAPEAYNFLLRFVEIFRKTTTEQWNKFGTMYNYALDRIYKVSLNKDGSKQKHVLTETPILVSGYFHEEDDERCQCQVEYFRDGAWHKLDRLVERSILVHKTKIMELANYDLDVSTRNAKELAEYFQDYFNLARNTMPNHDIVRSLGWRQHKFYFPGLPMQDKLEIDPGVLQAIKEPAGDYTVWKECAQKVRQMGWVNRFILAAAFAAPLVYLVDYRANPIFLYAGESGKGKTTIFRLAASVWGTEKFLFSADSTKAGAEVRAATLNDVLFAMDDLEKALIGKDKYEKTELVKDILYMLYNGKGSNRSNQHLEAVPTLGWRCVSLINSERSVMQQFVKQGSFRRLVEIHNETELSYDEKMAIDKVTAHNYGHACREWLKWLPTVPLDGLCEFYLDMVKELQQYDQGVHNTSHIDAIAIVAVTDALVNYFIFAEESFDVSIDKAVEMAKYILAQQEPEANKHNGAKLYEAFKSWVQANKNAFDIYPEKSSKAPSIVHRTAVGYGALQGQMAYVIPEYFDAFIEKYGLAADIGRRTLFGFGVLLKGSNGYTKNKRFSDYQSKYICVKLELDNEEV